MRERKWEKGKKRRINDERGKNKRRRENNYGLSHGKGLKTKRRRKDMVNTDEKKEKRGRKYSLKEIARGEERKTRKIVSLQEGQRRKWQRRRSRRRRSSPSRSWGQCPRTRSSLP